MVHTALPLRIYIDGHSIPQHPVADHVTDVPLLMQKSILLPTLLIDQLFQQYLSSTQSLSGLSHAKLLHKLRFRLGSNYFSGLVHM